MAKYSSASCSFFEANGDNILPDLQTVSDKVKGLLEDTTVLGDAWMENGFVGVKSFDLTLQGFYDDAAGAIDAAMIGSIGATQLITFAPFGNLLGSRVTIYAAPLVSDYDRTAAIAKFTKAGVTYTGSGQVYQNGQLVLPRQTATSAFNTSATPLDNGASSANGGVAVLQVEGVTLGGYTSWTVKLRHSADNVTYVDLATFTIVTTAPVAQLLNIVGTINRYVDVDVSLQGAGSGPSIGPLSVALVRL